jgi:hypothetical protein
LGSELALQSTINIKLEHYKDLSSLEILEFMCEDVVSFIFPTLQRLKGVGSRVRFVLSGGNMIWKKIFISA